MDESNIKKGIMVVIFVFIIAIVSILATNILSPSYTSINMLGVSLEVPEGSFDYQSSIYDVYSVYNDKHGDWSVSAINLNNLNLNNSKHQEVLESFSLDKNTTILFNNKYFVEDICLYKIKSDDVVSFFKVNDIEFKVSANENTAISIIKSIKTLNKNSTIQFE